MEDRLKSLNLSNLNLLYVEDDKELQESAKEFFEIYFKRVHTADNGADALTTFDENSINIIICDISMPRLNGIEFAKIIRKKSSDIPIIITTAYAKVDYLLDAVELNLVTYLLKPVSEDKLFNALKMAYLKIHPQEEITLLKDTIFYPQESIVKSPNKTIKLTKKERELLHLLVKNSHRSITYEEIEGIVWSAEYVSIESIRTVVKALRQKISKDLIENISGFGYRINIEM